ncbi:uncharacterized protein LOC129744273 [Uranotaenia lowii]|uniref:uncharacterized protein LOC129744273 n=1 Tax=Uranotaenia lowii TaxID=190385 RepID=UPI00247A57A4|nr:uncharacterized protein LOC129744273 [Uranotaenia lowii]
MMLNRSEFLLIFAALIPSLFITLCYALPEEDEPPWPAMEFFKRSAAQNGLTLPEQNSTNPTKVKRDAVMSMLLRRLRSPGFECVQGTRSNMCYNKDTGEMVLHRINEGGRVGR